MSYYDRCHMENLDYKVREELMRLENRYTLVHRDWLWFFAGITTTLLIVFGDKHDSDDFLMPILVGGIVMAAIYGFYRWFQYVTDRESSAVYNAAVALEKHISELGRQKYAEGYRDGVSAANSESIDPEYM